MCTPLSNTEFLNDLTKSNWADPSPTSKPAPRTQPKEEPKEQEKEKEEPKQEREYTTEQESAVKR